MMELPFPAPELVNGRPLRERVTRLLHLRHGLPLLDRHPAGPMLDTGLRDTAVLLAFADFYGGIEPVMWQRLDDTLTHLETLFAELTKGN